MRRPLLHAAFIALLSGTALATPFVTVQSTRFKAQPGILAVTLGTLTRGTRLDAQCGFSDWCSARWHGRTVYIQKYTLRVMHRTRSTSSRPAWTNGWT